MRLARYVLLGVAVAIPSSTSAQTDEEQIVDVAQGLFQAMLHKDVSTIRSLMIDGARLLAVDNRQQPTAVSWTSEEQFAERIAGSEGELLERMWDPKVRVDGDFAQLWTTYDFYIGGSFSHCGVDAFHMVRTANGWKIAQISYTRRIENCYSPLGKPTPDP